MKQKSPHATAEDVCRGRSDYIVSVILTFEQKDLVRAITYGRKRKLTHERDEEFGALLISAMEEGVVRAVDLEVEYEEGRDDPAR